MKKILSVLIFLPLLTLAQKYDAGKFYISLENAYSPLGINEYQGFLKNSSLLSYGNEWVTGVTLDGDDDNEFGVDYYDSDNQSDNKSNFNISGKFGFFVANRLLAGVGTEYCAINSNSKHEDDFDGDGFDDEYESKSSYSSYALSPFIKFYIPFDNNALFFNTSYTFGSIIGEEEEEYDYTFATDYVYEFEMEPVKTNRLTFSTGFSFYITEIFSLESSLNYSVSKYTQEEEVFIGNSQSGFALYDDQDRVVSTHAFFFSFGASLYL